MFQRLDAILTRTGKLIVPMAILCGIGIALVHLGLRVNFEALLWLGFGIGIPFWL